MKEVVDRLRMIFLAIFVLIVGIYNPKIVMQALGEVIGDAEEYNPIKIRERQRREFLASYTSITQKEVK
jgi:hypothetical protein